MMTTTQPEINTTDLKLEVSSDDNDDNDDVLIATQVKDMEEKEEEKGDEKEEYEGGKGKGGLTNPKNATSTLDALKAYKKSRVYGRVSSTSTPTATTTATSTSASASSMPVSITATASTGDKEEEDEEIIESKTDVTCDETIQHENDDDSIATVQMNEGLFRMEDDEDETNSIKAEEKMENESLEVNDTNSNDGNGDDDEMLVLDQTQLSQEEDDHSQNNNYSEEENNNDSNNDETPEESMPRIGRRKKKSFSGEKEESNETKETSMASVVSKKTMVEENHDGDEDEDTFSLTQEQDTQDDPQESDEKEEAQQQEMDHDLEPQSISKRELRKMIRDVFYQKYPNQESMGSIKDFRIALETSNDVKLDKEQRKMMKKELILLMNPESDDEASTETTKKTPKAENHKSEEEETDYEADDDEKEEKIDSKRNSPNRPKRSKKTRRTPTHIKIHHEMRRKKVLAEAKIRAEEMQAERSKKLNEEDQERAQLIAKKFDTNTEEARVQRMEDRIGLLGRLKQKRLDVLTVRNGDEDNNDEQDEKEDEVKQSFLSSMNQKDQDDILVFDDNDSQDGEGSSEEESSDEDDDDELEIVGRTTKTEIKPTAVPLRKHSPTSVLDYFGLKAQSSNSKHPSTKVQNNIVAASFSNPRAALRNALRAKQFESGNRWLAKELGYDRSEDHIRECKMIEKKKQKQIFLKEEERLRVLHERNERLNTIVTGKEEEVMEEAISDEKDGEENQQRTIVNVNGESDDEAEIEEEDEEIAMAREIESEKKELAKENNTDYISDNESSSKAREEGNTLVHDSTEPIQSSTGLNENEDIVLDSTQLDNEEGSNEQSAIDSSDNEIGNSSDSNEPTSTQEGKEDKEQITDEENINQSANKKDKRPKNAVWKAILEKEKQLLKKQKSLRIGKTVDDEAEEEDEEEGVAGLEDFGFTMKSKQKGDDNEDVDPDDDDFEDIVDEVSDGEGDEEAGEEARKSLQAQEEKSRHKEVLRRIREGYDGKRGGVAGGGSKRGNLRFDQLVAADNRNDAKRLGLLNDDELDSEGEEANGTGDVEDEEVLIDRMLKERYLNKPNVPDEEFSDSEGEKDDEQNGEDTNEEDEEDKEQDRLAKRFAKRARMNRILMVHGDDQEFSQSRLLDEDKELKRELTKIRTVHGKRIRRQVSSSSASAIADSNLSNFSTSDSGSQSKSQDSSLLSFGSTLSIALKRTQVKKRKTSFLGRGQFNGRSKSAIKRRAVSLGHVVFTEDVSNSIASISKPSSSAIISGSMSHPKTDSGGSSPQSRKRRNSGVENKRVSLWSKVSAIRSQTRRRR